MPLARTFDPVRRVVVSTAYDGYVDRCSRWSDIQEYLPFLHATARSYPAPRILELGTRKGNSTLAFLAACEAAAAGHVWSVDVSACDLDPEGMAPWRHCPLWTFTRGDDIDASVQSLLPARCDVLFIDTSHEYEHTLAELQAFVPRVSAGGVVLMHDTHVRGWPGYEWDRDVSPVWAALDEYCAEAGLSWEDKPGRYGLGIIRP